MTISALCYSEIDSFALKGILKELVQLQQDFHILWWLDISVAFWFLIVMLYTGECLCLCKIYSKMFFGGKLAEW